jgi:hypothetical protein
MDPEAPLPMSSDLRETLEEFVRQTEGFQHNILSIVSELVHTQTELVEIVDSMSTELAALSQPPATREGNRVDTPVAVVGDHALQARQRAAELTERAATLASRARAS